MSRKHVCGHWNVETRTYCGQDASLYPSGAYCGPHSPATMSGRAVPTPDPQWTAQAFRERIRRRPDPLDNLPDTCPHEEPKGPRYCALCRRQARMESLWAKPESPAAPPAEAGSSTPASTRPDVPPVPS